MYQLQMKIEESCRENCRPDWVKRHLNRTWFNIFVSIFVYLRVVETFFANNTPKYKSTNLQCQQFELKNSIENTSQFNQIFFIYFAWPLFIPCIQDEMVFFIYICSIVVECFSFSSFGRGWGVCWNINTNFQFLTHVFIIKCHLVWICLCFT